MHRRIVNIEVNEAGNVVMEDLNGDPVCALRIDVPADEVLMIRDLLNLRAEKELRFDD